MDPKKLDFQIKILRIIKPVATEAQSASEKISLKLQDIHKISGSVQNEEWQQFQAETYKDLTNIGTISSEFEAKKQRLIAQQPYQSLPVDPDTTVEFDRQANVIKVFKEGSVSEIL